MATYFYGHPIRRTDRQCTRPGRDPELFGGLSSLDCTNHTRLWRRRRTPYPWFGLLWPHTSMATQRRARTASARGLVEMQNCCGTPYIGLHPPHPLVASGTHAVPVVWTSMATYSYGHPIPRTDRQCTRPGRDAELLGGLLILSCTRHTRLSRRGRTPYLWFGLLWPHSSMATQFCARTNSAPGPVGMRICWGDAPRWFAPTRPACRVADARRTRGLDFYGNILLWPTSCANGPPVHAAR